MMVLLLIYYLLITTFQLSAVSGQTFSFNQTATGPPSVCEGNEVTLQCVLIFTSADNATVTVQSNVWSRNISGVVTTITAQTPIPDHRVMVNPNTGSFTDLVITNVTLEDNNAVYTCTASSTTITSSVVLNVTEIPPAENLMAVDNCTSVTVNWTIIDEGFCEDLSYNVSLISRDDGVTLQSITTIATNHTFTGVETSNEMFNVTVIAFNENATGSNRTATANVFANPPSPVRLRNVSTICVTFFNISWNAFNGITCGDVSYNVLVFPLPIEQSMEEITRIGDVFNFSVTGLNNSDPDVMVIVTASNRAGQGNMSIPVSLPPSKRPPPVNDVTASTNSTPANLTGFDIFIMWTRPVIDDPCTTLSISQYTINASVTFMNGSQANYVSNNIKDTSGDSMGRFNVSYNDSFDEELVPKATYNFTVNSDNTQLPPTPPTPTRTSTNPVIIIVICIIAAGVLLICAGVAATYLYVKYGSDPSTAVKLLMWALFLISLGVGLIFVAIWLCKNRKDDGVLPDEREMTGHKQSDDLYASPKKGQEEDTDGKAAQPVYSYARTGPINVVVAGGKP